jgi:hypothetical protein
MRGGDRRSEVLPPVKRVETHQRLWRGRMGVEPSGAGITNAYAVLKLAGQPSIASDPVQNPCDSGSVSSTSSIGWYRLWGNFRVNGNIGSTGSTPSTRGHEGDLRTFVLIGILGAGVDLLGRQHPLSHPSTPDAAPASSTLAPRISGARLWAGRTRLHLGGISRAACGSRW